MWYMWNKQILILEAATVGISNGGYMVYESVMSNSPTTNK